MLHHQLIDPATKKKIRARLLFVYSSADECECRQRRQENITKIHTGLEALQAKLLRSHPQCTMRQHHAKSYNSWAKRTPPATLAGSSCR